MAAARISSRLAAVGFLLWTAAAGAQENAPDPEAEGLDGETGDIPVLLPVPNPLRATAAGTGAPAATPGAAAAAGRTAPLASAAGAVDPVTTGSAGRRVAPGDPYAPLGIRAGSLILLPAVELTAGYSNNATASAGGSGSGELTVAPQLEIRSDWNRHRARLLLRGAYETFSDGSIDPKPSAGVEADGRIDVIGGWVVDLAGTYNLEQQSLSDPDFPAGVDSAPAIHDFTGEAAVRKTVGPLLLDIGGRVERSVYEDGSAGGVIVDQGDRSFTLVEERVRAGVDFGRALSPFIEGRLFQRIYDREIDSGGLRQDGHGYHLRAGLAIDSAPVVTGEVAVGYRREQRDDPALQTLDAVTFDGSLVWSPTPLITVTTTGGTSLSPSSDTTTQGSVTHSGAFDLAYAYRDNLTFRLSGSADAERFIGTGAVDYTFALGAGATWRLNRFVQLDSDYQHEWLDSADPTRSYQADTVTLGLTLRR